MKVRGLIENCLLALMISVFAQFSSASGVAKDDKKAGEQSLGKPVFEIKLNQDPEFCSTVWSALERRYKVMSEKKVIWKSDSNIAEEPDTTFDGLAGHIEWSTGNMPPELNNARVLRWAEVDIDRDGKIEYLGDTAWDTSECCLGSNFILMSRGGNENDALVTHNSTDILYKSGLSDMVNQSMEGRVFVDWRREGLKKQGNIRFPYGISISASNYKKVFGFLGAYYLYMRGEYVSKMHPNSVGGYDNETRPYNEWVLISKLNNWWFLPAKPPAADAIEETLVKVGIDPDLGVANDNLLDADPVCGFKRNVK